MPYLETSMNDIGVVTYRFAYGRKITHGIIPALVNPFEYAKVLDNGSPRSKYLLHRLDLSAIALGRFMRHMDEL